MLAFAPAVQASPEAVYFVGNSFTWDSSPATRVPSLSGELGVSLTVGHHINCGATLNDIWIDPADTCVASPAPFGTFDDALPNFEWSAVTLQPFNDALGGDSGAVNRIGQFIEAARSGGLNADTRFYVYSGWPAPWNDPNFDYSAAWERAYDPANTSTTWTRDYFDQVMQGLAGDGNGEALMIPVGEVLYELDQRARAGLLPGVDSANDLYRDELHLNNIGGYAASLTVVSTLWGESPIGLTDGTNMSPELSLAVQQAVWDVVRAHPYTGIPEPAGVAGTGAGLLLLLKRRRA